MVGLKAVVGVVAVAAMTFSCVTEGCTEIGCPAGVRFELTPPLQTTGDVTVELSGNIVITCTQAASTVSGPCLDAGLTFTFQEGALTAVDMVGKNPKTVAMRLLVNGVVEREISTTTVTYRDARPNGPDCPGCQAATLDLTAP